VGSKAKQAGGLCRDEGDPVVFNISVKAQAGKGDVLFQADSNSNLEFKFESLTNKIQIKPIKLQNFHPSNYNS
jgi:cytochrome c oxidase assembly protein Cox11